MGNITVVMNPEQRQKYISSMLELDGLTDVVEDPQQAYTPISLTSTPEELKEFLKTRQQNLKDVLAKADIRVYDPGASDKYNPDTNKDASPQEVYDFDTRKVVGSRFFTGHLLLPSLGQGNEAEKARVYNRISVIFLDKKIRVSRMLPPRAVYLWYENFDQQAAEFIPVFSMLKEYEPGIGFNNGLPVLLGFEKRGGRLVDLEEAVYNAFPGLQFRYDSKTPIVKMRAENPELFYEFRQGLSTTS